MNTLIGVDVSKSTARVAVLSNMDVVFETKITLDILGLKTLQDLYQQYLATSVVFESTGVYSRRLERYLVTHAMKYRILNPLVAKKRMDNGTRLRKNDKLDAIQLAQSEVMEMMHSMQVLSSPKATTYAELTDMNRFYDQLTEDKKRAKNRLHRLLQLTFASFSDSFDLSNKSSLALLLLFPSSEKVIDKDLKEIELLIENMHIPGVGVYRCSTLARKLMKCAAINQVAVSMTSHNLYQVTYQVQEIQKLIITQAQLIEDMSSLAKTLPEYDILQTIPGIGQGTAVRLIGELGDLRRFNTSQQLNSFIGIDLVTIDSGNYQSKRHITKHGNPHARKILYWTIVNQVSSLAKDNHIRDIYKKRQLTSSSKKKLIISLMDHLLRTILHLIKTNMPYSYDIASQN